MKTAGKYIAAFCACAALLCALLVGSALIPRGAIEENMRASADYLAADEPFPKLLSGVESSRIDRYADAILLNIAWEYDAARPLESVMRSAYCHQDAQNENLNLHDAVYDGLPANRQYLRYWHGSIASVRPLLTVLSLPGIYALHGVVMALLAGWLLFLLWRRGERAAALGVLAGLLAAAFWFAPLSLEYTWMCLLSLVLCLLVPRFAAREKQERAGLLFLMGGMAASFLDFLTAETLTLTLPLLLLVWLRRREKEASPVKTAWRSALAWGAGYAGMWAAKWLLASLVLGENAMPYVAEHVEERAISAVDGLGPLGMALGALWRNLTCLFPLGWGLLGALAGVALILAAAYYGYVYRRPGWDKTLVLTCAAIGLVPYVRYLALGNHSYIHYFFTFRAQAGTVLALVLILAELTERGRSDGGKRRKRA